MSDLAVTKGLGASQRIGLLSCRRSIGVDRMTGEETNRPRRRPGSRNDMVGVCERGGVGKRVGGIREGARVRIWGAASKED